jgi:hypothetical protein
MSELRAGVAGDHVVFSNSDTGEVFAIPAEAWRELSALLGPAPMTAEPARVPVVA